MRRATWESCIILLGVEFERIKKTCTIIMNQMSNIEEVFKVFEMKKCKQMRIPFDANSKLLKPSDEDFENISKEK